MTTTQKFNAEAGPRNEMEKLKKPTWKNEYLASKEPDDNDWWGDKANISKPLGQVLNGRWKVWVPERQKERKLGPKRISKTLWFHAHVRQPKFRCFQCRSLQSNVIAYTPHLFVTTTQKSKSEAKARNEKPKKLAWKNENLAWKEPDDSDGWGEKQTIESLRIRPN